ncbi:MAG: hypothetical protein ACR2RF_00985 [Geminicoccaceae bacterium]
MTAGRKPPPGLSVIEQMAAVHHDRQGLSRNWEQLSRDDRLRKMDAMEAAVEIIPDRLGLKHQVAAETGNTGEGREALLGDHRHAKTSAIYGH